MEMPTDDEIQELTERERDMLLEMLEKDKLKRTSKSNPTPKYLFSFDLEIRLLKHSLIRFADFSFFKLTIILEKLENQAFCPDLNTPQPQYTL